MPTDRTPAHSDCFALHSFDREPKFIPLPPAEQGNQSLDPKVHRLVTDSPNSMVSRVDEQYAADARELFGWAQRQPRTVKPRTIRI